MNGTGTELRRTVRSPRIKKPPATGDRGFSFWSECSSGGLIQVAVQVPGLPVPSQNNAPAQDGVLATVGSTSNGVSKENRLVFLARVDKIRLNGVTEPLKHRPDYVRQFQSPPASLLPVKAARWCSTLCRRRRPALAGRRANGTFLCYDFRRRSAIDTMLTTDNVTCFVSYTDYTYAYHYCDKKHNRASRITGWLFCERTVSAVTYRVPDPKRQEGMRNSDRRICRLAFFAVACFSGQFAKTCPPSAPSLPARM